jgi:hypothetical protein
MRRMTASLLTGGGRVNSLGESYLSSLTLRRAGRLCTSRFVCFRAQEILDKNKARLGGPSQPLAVVSSVMPRLKAAEASRDDLVGRPLS